MPFYRFLYYRRYECLRTNYCDRFVVSDKKNVDSLLVIIKIILALKNVNALRIVINNLFFFHCPLCPLCKLQNYDTIRLFNCRHPPMTLTVMDLWSNPESDEWLPC